MTSQQSSTETLPNEVDELDDDFPLAGPHALNSLRRAHTTTSSNSRLYRINSPPGGVLSLSPSGSTGHRLARAEKPVSTSLGGAIRSSPSTSRLNSNASELETNGEMNLTKAHHEQNHSKIQGSLGYQGIDEEEEYILHHDGISSLSRHSSMPVSRTFRKGNNAGAPWNRDVDYDMAAAGPSSPSFEQRLRSNSTVSEVCDHYHDRLSSLSNMSSLSQRQVAPGLSSPVEQFFSSGISNTSKIPGFVVTSRPSNLMRNSFNHPSSLASHNRSWSMGVEPVTPTSLSPNHSRHASENALNTVSKGSQGDSNTSTPSPASPIDPSLMGQANPWSPTAQEKQRLALPVTNHHHVSTPVQEGSPTKRSNSIKRQSTPTRNRSLTGAGAQPSQQRRSIPLLPPLLTNSDALYIGTLQNQQDNRPTAQGTVMQNGPSVNDIPTQHVAAHQTHTQSPPNAINRTASISRILRGPQSAAPYVPPIGHTHSMLPNGLSISSGSRGSSQQPTHQNGFSYLTARGLSNAGPVSAQAALSENKEHTASHSIEIPTGLLSANSASAQSILPFPSLNNLASAAAFSSNLALQQQLLAAQTQQLQDQQALLAAALQNGLSLHDGPVNSNNNQTHPSLVQQDPYTVAVRIDALQKANAAMVNPTPNSGNPSIPFGNFTSFSPLPPLMANSTIPTTMQTQQQQPYQQSTSFVQQNGHTNTAINPIDVSALVAAKGYNPATFDARPNSARFFVIKSFTEDDVFKSIK